MSNNRDKERDKAATRRLILDPNRPLYTGGENWLGHGGRGGRDAVIDFLLLDGATMKKLREERGTEASIRSHFQSLKTDHDLPVVRDADGRYRFDREHLGLPNASALVASAEAASVLPEEVVEPAGLVEGTVRTITVNAYERSPEVRRGCIAAHGTICAACGMSFGAEYGPVADGFIHVHHLRPLSEVGTSHIVDPVADLRPVCPNCHAVIHRRVPPYSVEEVRAFWQQRHAEPGSVLSRDLF